MTAHPHVDYLISRTGRPVHLAIFAYNAIYAYNDEYHSVRGGRFVPLCGQDRGARWRLTGTWAEKWPRHVKAGLCDRCRRRAFALVNSVFDVTWPDRDTANFDDGEPPLFEAIEVAS